MYSELVDPPGLFHYLALFQYVQYVKKCGLNVVLQIYKINNGGLKIMLKTVLIKTV